MAEQKTQSNRSAEEARERRKFNSRMTRLCLVVMLIVGVLESFGLFDGIAAIVAYPATWIVDENSPQYFAWVANVTQFFVWVKGIAFIGAFIFGCIFTKNNEV